MSARRRVWLGYGLIAQGAQAVELVIARGWPIGGFADGHVA
jgi:hypothetical protein